MRLRGTRKKVHKEVAEVFAKKCVTVVKVSNGYSVVLRFFCSCARCRRCINTEIKYHHYQASGQQIITISHITYYDG